ncbi:MAG: AraC family transcriptional regulator [Gelidibacter sp.]
MNPLNSFDIREGNNTDKQYYEGYIQKNNLTEVLESYGFKLQTHHGCHINFESQKDSAVYICVNLSSKLSLDLTCHISEIVIPPFASLLVPFQEAEKISFKCKPNTNYDFLLLKVYQPHLDIIHMELLQNLQGDDVFLNPFKSQKRLLPNLAICEFAKKLNLLDMTSGENKFMARGYSNILIGMKFKEILIEQSSKTNLLSNYEIQQLELVTDQILENPQNDYSIKELCKRTGLSVSKLQAGFKEKHECTVTIFIRNVRLEKALNMLQNTNLNISEIVYSVGLSSRSYFCRIFKKRFKCSPKLYQQRLKSEHIMAS